MRPTLAQATRTLTDVCMGRTPADLVITGGRLVNVHTREVQEVDVAVSIAITSRGRAENVPVRRLGAPGCERLAQAFPHFKAQAS